MSLISRVRSLWRNIVFRHQADQDLDEELQAARDLLIEEQLAAGLSLTAATRAAAIELGGLEQIKEQVRETASGAALNQLSRDVQHAIRLLLRRPAFAVTAILSLAVAIGAATATYSWVGHVLLWAPTGVKAPEELVAVYFGGEQGEDEFGNIISVPHFREIETVQTVFAAWAGSFPFYGALGVEKTAVETSIAFVTGNYFSGLGVQMAAGRGIQPADDVPGGPLSAVISHQLWQQKFGGAPTTLGGVINLNGQAFTVVGIAGPYFEGPQYTPYGRPDVWVAVNGWIPMFGPTRLTARGGRVPQLHTVARLKPGVDVRSARAALDAAVQHLSYTPADPQRIRTAHVLPLAEARIRPIYRPAISALLSLLFVVTLLILSAACINVANFLISHGVMRRVEMGVRLALGASRRQLLQQLLTECLVLGAISGTLGLVFAALFSRLLEQYPPTAFSMATFVIPATINAKALLFSVGVTLMTTVAFGLVPALWLSFEEPIAAVRHDEGRWSATGRRVRPRHLLLGAQVALSVLITIVAALYARSLAQINAVPYTFNGKSVLLARVNPLLLNPAQRQSFYRSLFERLLSNSSVVSAGAASNAPLAFGAAGVKAPLKAEPVRADFALAGPGYFHTLDIPVKAGREFDLSDETRRVTILNETLAQRLWPGESAVGKTVQFPGLPGAGFDFEVVGVVDQPRCQDMLDGAHPCVYTQLPSDRGGAVMLHVRTKGDPLAFAPVLRSMVGELASDVSLDRIGTFESHLQTIRAGPRIAALMTASLALLTCILTAIGCVALLWSLINEARRELAIRLALGSSSRGLIRIVMLRVLTPYAAGMAMGLLAARLTAGRISPQLYQTRTNDVPAYVVPAAILLLIGLLASYWPARQATRTNPSVLLRS